MADSMSPGPTSPARWAFEALARASYDYLSGKYKKQLRETLPRTELDTVIPIDRARTGVLAGELEQQVEQFLQHRNNFAQLVSASSISTSISCALIAFNIHPSMQEATLFALNRSIHTLSPATTQQLGRSLNALWCYLVVNRKCWARFQWVTTFLALLVRVSAKVRCDLMPVYLKPILEMRLPQTTTAMLLVALLDVVLSNKQATPTTPLVVFTEQAIRMCKNTAVKSYVLALNHWRPRHSTNSNDNWLARLKEHEPVVVAATAAAGESTFTTWPHNCCERTCCFVLANSSGSRSDTIDHLPIICNLQHAIEDLQRSGRSGRTLAAGELREMARLADLFRNLLGPMIK